MLFNSIQFLIFLPIVFLLYWFVFSKKLKLQNFFLLIASYFFYGCWDWRFLFLILFSSLVDFSVGIGLSKCEQKSRRKLLLFISVFVNLGFLAIFKYFNFFIENFMSLVFFLGFKINDPVFLQLILPVGISFYTFQTLSYTIDVYKKQIQPTTDLIGFLAFVSFFPQLVAGPIERAANLLPQFEKERYFSYENAVTGLRHILWGFVKKMVIADNCAVYVNEIFGQYETLNGSTLLLGAIFFSFQIYGDFSGYSDIAIGVAKLFGFDLMKNFNYPYFSRNIAEFWKRWHISLSTWFRDYVYIPLGGNRKGFRRQVINTMIIFLVSGFWHGANWTFIVWGLLNAVYFIPSLLKKRSSATEIVAKGKLLPSLKEFFQMVSTYLLTVLAWIIFRSDSVPDAVKYIRGIFNRTLFERPTVLSYKTIGFVLIFILLEWVQRESDSPFDFKFSRSNRMIRWGLYYIAIIVIVAYGGIQQEFIYFQF